jgi:hypothetical protein
LANRRTPFAKSENSQNRVGYHAISVTGTQTKSFDKGQNVFCSGLIFIARLSFLEREVSHEDKHRLREEQTVHFLFKR